MEKIKKLAKKFFNYCGYCMAIYGESIMISRGCGC